MGGALDLTHLPEPVRRSLDRHGAPAEPAPELPQPVVVLPQQSTFRTVQPAAEAGKSSKLSRGEAPSEEQLRELLTRHHGNIAAVGRELGKERMQVHRYLSKYKLDIEEFRR